jgi:hypothetical protein
VGAVDAELGEQAGPRGVEDVVIGRHEIAR